MIRTNHTGVYDGAVGGSGWKEPQCWKGVIRNHPPPNKHDTTLKKRKQPIQRIKTWVGKTKGMSPMD